MFLIYPINFKGYLMNGENFRDNVEGIKKIVESLQDEITNTDIKINSYVKSKDFIASKEINHFLSVWKEFQTTITNDCERCKKIIDTPLYIGVIGHFSHGKSSLINALITHPKSDYEILPTGESIVTSKVTLIQFTEGTDIERFGCKKEGEMGFIHDDEFKTLVAGKKQNPWDYFSINIGYEKSVDEKLFQSLSNYNICFFDTPGLASSYWSDRSELQDWLETFDVILLCIDGTNINSKISAILSETLAMCKGILVIPIITKWDLWNKSSEYKGIKEEFLARQKAKDLIKQYLPLLNESLEKGLIYFVSARNYHELKEVPTELSSDYTEYWNIDQVRREIARLVIEERNTLLTPRKKTAKLVEKRTKEVLDSINDLINDFEKFHTQCEEALPSFYLKSETLQLLSNGYEEFERRAKEKCINISNTLSGIIQDGTNSITDYSQIGGTQSEIENKVENAKKSLIEEYKESNIEHWFNEILRNPVIKKLKSSVDNEEGRRKIDELDEKMKDLIEEYNHSLSSQEIVFQPVEYKAVLLKEVAIESFKNIFTALITYIKKLISSIVSILSPIVLNPIVMIYTAIIGFVILLIYSLRDKITEIQKKAENYWWPKKMLYEAILTPIVWIFEGITGILSYVFGVIKSCFHWLFSKVIFPYMIWILGILFILFVLVYLSFLKKGWDEAKKRVLGSVKEALRARYSFEIVKKRIEETLRLNFLSDMSEEITENLKDLLDEIQRDEVILLYKDFSKKNLGIKQKLTDIKTGLLKK